MFSKQFLNLPHLVGFCHIALIGLDIDDFCDIVVQKDEVVAFNTAVKSDPSQEIAKLGKIDIMV